MRCEFFPVPAGRVRPAARRNPEGARGNAWVGSMLGCLHQQQGIQGRITMPTLFLKHKVKSYDSWRPAYDRHLVKRAEAGLREVGVFRDSKDPNDLLIVWTTYDVDQAKTFI